MTILLKTDNFDGLNKYYRKNGPRKSQNRGVSGPGVLPFEKKYKALFFVNYMRPRYSFSSRMTRVARSTNTNKHRKAFPKLAKEVIKISDIVLEVLDARFIEKTRNLEMEMYAKEEGKMIIYVINKSDLSDKNELMREVKLENLYPYVVYSCKSSVGRNQLRTLIKILVKKGKFAEKHAKAHVGVIGYPNTGKSTLINTLAAGGKAEASSESGFTKGIRRIKLNKDILILDTPGVFQESENTEKNISDLKKQSEIGSRNASSVKNPELIVHSLMQKNPGLFESYYNIPANGDSEDLINSLGKKKGFMRKGNMADSDKTARSILKDWQLGKIKKL